MAITGLTKLCRPAMFYLIISSIAIVVMAFQNLGDNHTYCVGSYSCSTASVISIFTLKIVYVLFWTWLLNIICKSGYEFISWFLVLIPFILLFVLIAIIFFSHFDSGKYLTFNIWSLS